MPPVTVAFSAEDAVSAKLLIRGGNYHLSLDDVRWSCAIDTTLEHDSKHNCLNAFHKLCRCESSPSRCYVQRSTALYTIALATFRPSEATPEVTCARARKRQNFFDKTFRILSLSALSMYCHTERYMPLHCRSDLSGYINDCQMPVSHRHLISSV